MVSDAARAPATLGVNASVAGTLVLPAKQTAGSIVIDAAVTLSPTLGLANDAGLASLDVRRFMELATDACAALTPIVSPVIVNVTAALAAMAELRVIVNAVDAV